MRRVQIFLPDDVEEREVVAMAASIGCFIRHVNGFTFMDRVPGVIRNDPPAENIVAMKPLRKQQR